MQLVKKLVCFFKEKIPTLKNVSKLKLQLQINSWAAAGNEPTTIVVTKQTR